MKIKENCKAMCCDSPYYDLFLGGRFKPEGLLDNPEDAKKVRAAMDLVEEYVDLLESEGVMEEM